jgi:quinoprotein glucose dehydrogenase
MPAFPALTDTVLNALISYLATPVSEATVPYKDSSPLSSQVPDEKSKPVRYVTSYGYLETKDIPSPISPPWSSLTAYDLNDGAIRWKIPYGNEPFYVERGVTGTGTIWPKSGVVVTGSGLIFGASRDDSTLRAYDETDGRTLWEISLPAGSDGVPAIYEVNGQEYIAICATSWASITSARNRSQQTKEYVVYALPRRPVGN